LGDTQHTENHVLLHNYNDADTVATCGAAEPVAAGLAIAATGVSTVTAANDIVEITTGVSPLKEGVVALGGNEDIYNGIRTGLDVATMLTPGGGGKTKVVEGALGFAASHTDDAARVAGTHADELVSSGTKGNSINWPPNNGAVPGTEREVRLGSGTVVGRYGDDAGKYVTNPGTPPELLSLPPGTNTAHYNEYTVLNDIPNVQQAEAAPWFGQPGGGTQYLLPDSIRGLRNDGYIK
jgi:hypothetical protein